MRLTENAVLVTESGEVAYIRSLPDPQRPGEARAKVKEIYNAATGAIVKAAPIAIHAVGDVFKWLGGFKNLPAKPRSGYDQYYNDFGPSNPKSPETLTNDGLLKCIVAFTDVLHQRVAKGGADGAEAKGTLDLIAVYNAEAANQIATAQRQALLEQLASSQFSDEELAAARAKKGVTPPAATVEADDEAEAVEAEATGTEG